MKTDKIATLVFVVWGVSVLISLSISVGILYVAYHFISKFW